MSNVQHAMFEREPIAKKRHHGCHPKNVNSLKMHLWKEDREEACQIENEFVHEIARYLVMAALQEDAQKGQAMKLRLDESLKRNFYPPPAIRTARLWIRDGKIYPPPAKVGRAYYVEENATFDDGRIRQRLAQRIPR